MREEEGWPGALLAACALGTYHALTVAVNHPFLENGASYLLPSDVTQRGWVAVVVTTSVPANPRHAEELSL